MKSKLTVAAVASLFFVTAIAFFVSTKTWQRWDIDTVWAGEVITRSKDIIRKLDTYHTQQGHYPESLVDLGAEYQQPPDFDSPKSDGVWQYRRLNDADYQLVAIGKSWVSSYDAIVYRKSGSYPKSWFHVFDSSHAKKLGDWWYVTGFSSFEKN